MNNNIQNPYDSLPADERKEIEEFDKKMADVQFFLDKTCNKKDCISCSAKAPRVFLGYRKEYPVIPVSTIGRYYPAYSLACTNCGFVSSYLAPIVDAGISRGNQNEG